MRISNVYKRTAVTALAAVLAASALSGCATRIPNDTLPPANPK